MINDRDSVLFISHFALNTVLSCRDNTLVPYNPFGADVLPNRTDIVSAACRDAR